MIIYLLKEGELEESDGEIVGFFSNRDQPETILKSLPARERVHFQIVEKELDVQTVSSSTGITVSLNDRLDILTVFRWINQDLIEVENSGMFYPMSLKSPEPKRLVWAFPGSFSEWEAIDFVKAKGKEFLDAGKWGDIEEG